MSMTCELTSAGMVHPCGSGAFGYFECTKGMSDLTYVVQNYTDKIWLYSLTPIM